MSTYTFKTVPHEWRNCEAWPNISVDHMEVDERPNFDRFALAIRAYLSDGALGEAARQGRCCKQTVIDKLNRCLTVDDEGRIAGWRGLLPYVRLTMSKYRRRELPVGARAAEQGASGAFEAFLCAHEDIRKRLHDAIRSGGSTSRRVKSRHPTFRSVFTAFKAACEAIGLTSSDYPLNSRSKGRRSVERYALAYIPTDSGAVDTWYGADARDHMRLGTGKKRFPLAMAPLDLCGADAHEMHCFGVVVISGPAGPQPVPIERIWVFPVIDFASRCVLGYAVAIRTEITAATVEAALAACNTPWAPRSLVVKGQAYAPGAGFPVGSIEGLTHCRPSTLQIDNAAQHYANRIIQTARRALGCAVTFGPVGGWWRNAFTERFFKSLEMYGFQCQPSSSGSNSLDVHRRDPVKSAIRHEITWQELLDLVDVLIANYNARPHDALGGQSPLTVMRRGLQPESSTYLPRMPVPDTAHTPSLGVTIEHRDIAGCAKRGSIVSPYVQIDETRYTNDRLSGRFDLIGNEIIVHVRERDMSVWGFLADGYAFGPLECQGPGWASHPHSRAMRKEINALIRNGLLLGIDPVTEYLAYLRRETLAEIEAAPDKISHAATRLSEASRISGLETVPEVARPTTSLHLVRPIPGHIRRPTWRQT